MSLRDSVMRRFALSEDGYRYLCRSSLACILKDLALMFPVMVLFMFVCDVMGGPGNPYDLDLGAWAYIAMIVVSAALIAVTYVFEYNETYFNTYKESSAKRIALAEKLRRLPMSYFGRKDPTDLTVRIMGDCTMQEQSMSHWFPELIGSMICISMLGIMILVFDPVMGAASLWPIPVSFAIVILSKRFQDRYNRYKFDDDVTGMKTGDEKTVEKTFGESETDDELRGRTVRLSIRLTKLKERILPEVDDEFAQDVKEEYKTVQDLKDGIRMDLENRADYTVRGEKLEKVLSAVIKSSKYEIPSSMERFSIDSATRDYLRQIGRSQEEIDRLMEVDDNLANMIRSMVTSGALRDLNQQIIINAIQKAGVVTVTDEEVEKAVEGRITDKTDEETAKRIREEAKDNLAFSKVPDYLIENNTFKLSGDPITPDEYMEDYYKRMSEEQAASEDAKEE